MPDGWPQFTQDDEKASRVPTKYAGVFIIEDAGQPFFTAIVKDALASLEAMPVGKLLLASIVASAPADNRGFKVLIKRIPLEFKEVSRDDKRVQFKPSGGRSYASAVQQSIGVASTGASNGQGASVIVGWCPNQVYVADHGRGGKKGFVPASVTLGHELIHGLHCLEGRLKSGQSISIKGKSTSEEEAQTVGLGPYANEQISENRLRQQTKPPLPERLTYP